MRLIDRLTFRAVDASAFLTADDDDLFLTHTGKVVTKEQALRLIAVYACVGIISDAIAAMPIDVVEGRGQDRRRVDPPLWLDAEMWPNPEQSLYQFIFRLLASVLLGGTGFGLVSAVDQLGFPIEVWNLASPVRSTRDRGFLEYEWPDGSRLSPYTPRNPTGRLIVVKGFDIGGDFGLDPIMNVAKQAIGLGLAAEEYGSRFFGQGQQPSGVIESQSSTVSEDDAKLMAETWREAHSGLKKAHLPAVLVNARWRQTSISNDAAQFIDTRRFQINELARLYRVPPHLISDVDRATSWGTGIEEQNVAFVRWTLQPWLTRLEQILSVLLPRGQNVKFNVASLERGSLKSRYEAYAISRQWGFLSVNEIRSLEDLAPIGDEGNAFLQPLNLTPAGSAQASGEGV